MVTKHVIFITNGDFVDRRDFPTECAARREQTRMDRKGYDTRYMVVKE